MIHRGPDDEGLWCDEAGRVGLAHRRLSIIDLTSAGAQPMHDPDTGNVAVFNGEIYNYRELRQQLVARGVTFRSESDTEVLLHLYALYAATMVQHLRGMFAFAIWDARSQGLFLARDPLGIKPLYYADDGCQLRFASQVKAILAGGGVSTAPSPAGWAGFCLFGHVPEPFTWVDAIKAVPAGATLWVEPDKPTRAPRKYFDLRDEIFCAQEATENSSDAVEEALIAVTDSVKYHMVADVPVGVFLSAGRDSTLVAAIAARCTEKPLSAFTLGFDEFRGTDSDEVPVAKAVAQQLGFLHEAHVIRRNDFDTHRERILSAMDQPSIDGVNTWLVSQAAAKSGLKVALSGLGGDELFGGYPSFGQVPRLALLLRPLARARWIGSLLRAFGAPIVRRFTNPKWAGLFEYGATLEGAWLLRRALFMPWELPGILEPDFARSGLEKLSVLDELRERIRGIRDPRLAVMALEMSGYMRNQLLRDADWAGMAHSLEIRVPLVDAALLRRWLRVAAHRFPLERQRLLEAADPQIALIIGARPKSGFGVPVERWLADCNPAKAPGLRPWSRVVAAAFPGDVPKLRIGALLTDAHGGIGGIAKFNRDLLDALSRMPDVREIIALPRLIQRTMEPVPPKVRYELAAARGKLRFGLRALRLGLGGPRLSLVVCGHINLLPFAWPLSRVHGCPLLLIAHGIEAWQPHWNPLVRKLVGSTDVIVTVSRYTAERLNTWAGVPAERFRVLPNCVNLDVFTPRPRNTALARRYNIEGRRVLLTVGRLAGNERYKGFDEILEALQQLAHNMPDVCYVIVGDGNDRERLRAKAHALGVADRVVFTGFVSEEEKIDLYNLADVYVMPSRGEGFGIVFLEAMACGVPAIGSVLDGSRDALREGQLGQLVDPREPQQLVEAIGRAMATPRGRPVGLEYFSEGAFRERMAAIVRESVHPRR